MCLLTWNVIMTDIASRIDSPPEPRTVPVVFTGKSGEFFKLWIVNLLLTIVTLGIYSAWAKVRNTQYMHGHTSVEGHRLRYLATPMQILKGRIIAFLVFVVVSVLMELSPYAALGLSVVLLIALPWLLVQGIRFSLRMTAYRNVRFSFTGTYGGALLNFMVYPLLGVLSFYLAFPWVMRQMDKYVYDHITFGGKPFSLNSSIGHYFGVAIICMIMAVLVMVVLSAGAFMIVGGKSVGAEGFDVENFSMIALPVFAIGYILVGYGVMGFYQANIHNHIMMNLKMDGVASFTSTLSVVGFIGLVITNFLLLVVTAGLAFPVTQIRTRAYLSRATMITLESGIDTVVNTVLDEDSALGEEAAGMFDAEVSLIG